jgi:hypothetical protein
VLTSFPCLFCPFERLPQVIAHLLPLPTLPLFLHTLLLFSTGPLLLLHELLVQALLFLLLPALLLLQLPHAIQPEVAVHGVPPLAISSRERRERDSGRSVRGAPELAVSR